MKALLMDGTANCRRRARGRVSYLGQRRQPESPRQRYSFNSRSTHNFPSSHSLNSHPLHQGALPHPEIALQRVGLTSQTPPRQRSRRRGSIGTSWYDW